MRACAASLALAALLACTAAEPVLRHHPVAAAGMNADRNQEIVSTLDGGAFSLLLAEHDHRFHVEAGRCADGRGRGREIAVTSAGGPLLQDGAYFGYALVRTLPGRHLLVEAYREAGDVVAERHLVSW